ncbi:RHS repeat domain-containing protein [Micromonospora sp. 4G55]|uniref:RHS repeat domain-containing protein n=1 Tax=Micromonospora sp. 4G55 TaxID=2806102 RepID=UPI001A5F7BBD|nr:RHS repeat-associated core domain-containing protein [Micromonospora sp. 4G55]MBM0256064.1 hypothetical protein [Micromonospora sp. 4G55]
MTYGYHANGLVKSRVQNDTTTANQARTETFDYDSLGRLTNWNLTNGTDPKLSTTYGYDTVGNLTTLTNTAGVNEIRTYGKTTGGVTSQPHTLTALNGSGYAYDAKGRQASGGARQNITYTSFDLPRSITTEGGKTTTYSYDAYGRRAKEANAVTGTTTFYIPGLYEEHRQSGATTKQVHYVTSPDGPIAQVTYDHTKAGNPATTLYQLTDHLGSTTTAVDTTGAVKQTNYYDPFGKAITAGGTATTTPLTGPVTHGFTGHEDDSELGLVNMNGRVFDPILKRFLTPDPVVSNPLSTQNWNPYSYVNNSPLNNIDPTGNETECTRDGQGNITCYSPEIVITDGAIDAAGGAGPHVNPAGETARSEPTTSDAVTDTTVREPVGGYNPNKYAEEWGGFPGGLVDPWRNLIHNDEYEGHLRQMEAEMYMRAFNGDDSILRRQAALRKQALEMFYGLKAAAEAQQNFNAVVQQGFAIAAGQRSDPPVRAGGSADAPAGILPGGHRASVEGHGGIGLAPGDKTGVVASGSSVTMLRPGVALSDDYASLMAENDWAEIGRQFETNANAGRYDTLEVNGMNRYFSTSARGTFEGARTLLPGANVPAAYVGAGAGGLTVHENSWLPQNVWLADVVGVPDAGHHNWVVCTVCFW